MLHLEESQAQQPSVEIFSLHGLNAEVSRSKI
jgi:hypothetical protein